MITNSAKKIFKNILFSLILILLLSSGTFLSTSLFTVNAASYTITYNANGENISTSSQSVEKGAEFTLPSSADSDIMWFREGAEVYNISSLSDFRSLGYEVIAGTHSTENKIYMLNTDLDLSGVSWTPFDLTNCFFNGNGHTISNLTISSPNYTSGNYGHTGLFARVNANILNLNLKNVNINITSSDRTLYIGGLAGVLYSGYTIKNCSVSGNISVTTDTANYVGGLVGSAGNFINCINTCTITTKSNNSLVNAGGIVGGNAENIKNCYNLGNISATSASSSTPRAGGITGHVFSGDVIQNCFNAGNVTAKKGSSYSSTSAQLIDGSSQATITNCYFLSGTKVNGTSKTATVAGQATVKSSASALASAFYSNLSGEVTNWTNASYPTLTFVENDKNSYLNYYGQYYAGKGGDKIKYNFASDITLKAMTYKNEAYLTNDWFRKTGYIEDIVKIIFTDNLADIESCTNKVSVGADDENGTPFTGKICNDVLACWDNATTITLYIYSPSTIYAPSDSGELFSKPYLKTIDFNGTQFDTSKVTNMAYMFAIVDGYIDIETLDVSNFDTSNVISMYGMFSGCESLTALDVSNFDTSNVESMGWMFYGCESLTALDVSNFDTSNVLSMDYMFCACRSLTTLDLSSFNTSKVTYMNYMFAGCELLTTLDVSNFDTSNVTYMNDMFSGCSSLTTLDLSNFDTSNVTRMYSMFDGCSSLTKLDVSSFDTSKVTGMQYMFRDCSSLTILDLSNFDVTNTTNFYSMISETINLKKIVLPYNINEGANGYSYDIDLPSTNFYNIDTGYQYENGMVTRVNDSESKENPTTIAYRYNITYNFTGADALNNPTTYYFSDKPQTIALNLPQSGTLTTTLGIIAGNTLTIPANTAGDITIVLNNNVKNEAYLTTDWYIKAGLTGEKVYVTRQDLDKIVFTDNIEDIAGCTNIVSVGADNENGTAFTGNVCNDVLACWSDSSSITIYIYSPSTIYAPSDSSNLFNPLVTTIDFNGTQFDTSKVTNMSSMFVQGDYTGNKLETLDLSSFDTSNVINMYGMFFACKSLTTLDISSFDTSNVTDMSSMFYYCASLTTLNLSDFDTSNVTSTNDMFKSCASLSALDISNFNTSKVTNMSGMFDGCELLTELDLSSFNTSNVTNMRAMFYDCASLTTLDLCSFDLTKVTNLLNILRGTTNLKKIVLPYNVQDSYQFTLPSTSFYNIATGEAYSDAIVTSTKDSESKENPTTVAVKYNISYNLYGVTETLENPTCYYYSDDEQEIVLTLPQEEGNYNWETTLGTIVGNTLTIPTKATSDITIELSNVQNEAYLTTDWYEKLGLFDGDDKFRTDIDKIVFTDDLEDVADCTNSVSVGADDENGTAYTGKACNDVIVYWNDGANITLYIYSPSTIYAPSNSRDLFLPLVTSIDFNGTQFDTSKTTNMSFMFAPFGYEHSRLKSIDLSNFDTSNVTYMNDMFSGCSSLTTLDLSSFDLTNVESVYVMFGILPDIQRIVLPYNVKDSYIHPIYGEHKFMLPDGDFYNIATGEAYSDAIVTSTKDSESKENPTTVAVKYNISYNLYGVTETLENPTCYYYSDDEQEIVLTLPQEEGNYNWETTLGTIVGNILTIPAKASSDITIELYNVKNEAYLTTDWYIKAGLVNENNESIINIDKIVFTDNFEDIAGCANKISVGADDENGTAYTGTVCNDVMVCWNDSDKITIYIYSPSTIYAPSDSTKLFSLLVTAIDFNGTQFNTSKVTSMHNMFYGCTTLTSLDLSSFDTSKVTTMYGMFYGCKSLTTLDLSTFNTSEVTSMSSMFNKCSSLSSLNISNFNTIKVTGMMQMFRYCESLTSLNLGSFDLTNTIYISNMFARTTNLKKIVLPYNVKDSFDTDKFTLPSSYFYNITTGEEYSNAVVTSSKDSVSKENPTIVAYRYNITYILNEGVNANGNPEYYYFSDSEQNITLGTPEKAGYGFNGWTTDVGSVSGNTWTIPASSVNNATLTAQWGEAIYTIIYNDNGATGSVASQTVGYGENVTLSNGAALSKTGYILTSWNTQADGNGTTYALSYAFTPYNLGSDLTLYAIWEANTYTITYNSNTGNGTIENQTATYGQNVTLSNGAELSKTGYTLTSWNTQADGNGTSYALSYAFNPYNLGSDLTLYAIWEINTYTITVTAGENGSINPSQTTNVNYGESKTFTFTANEGYYVSEVKVDGVALNATELQNAITNGYTFENVTDNHTISVTFAINLVNSYEITYNSNGGTGSVSSQTVNENGNVTLSNGAQLSKFGYTLTEWNTQADGNGTSYALSYAFNPYNLGSNLTLFAVWNANTYTINYYLDGGIEGSSIPLTANYGQIITISNPSKSGFVFAGWTATNLNTETARYGAAIPISIWNGTVLVASEKFINLRSEAGVVTLKANWAENVFTISYNVNGGTGAIANQNVIDNASVTLSNGLDISKVGYTLESWNTQANGSGTTYALGATINPYNLNSNLTLFAQWRINTYIITVTAGSNGSISPNNNVSLNYNQSQTFTFTPNTGYHVSNISIDGTALSQNDLENAISNGYTFANVSDNHSIEVEFAINIYTITVTAGDNGSITPNGNVTAEYGQDKTFIITANSGYKVSSVTIDGTQVSVNELADIIANGYTFADISDNHTISAEFESISYDIILSIEGDGEVTCDDSLENIVPGEDRVLKIQVDLGQYDVKVYVNDVLVNTDGKEFTIENINQDTNVKVEFIKKSFFASITGIITIISVVAGIIILVVVIQIIIIKRRKY